MNKIFVVIFSLSLSGLNCAQLESDSKQDFEIKEVIPYLPTDDQIDKKDFVKIEVILKEQILTTRFCCFLNCKTNIDWGFEIFVPKKCKREELIKFFDAMYYKMEFKGRYDFKFWQFDTRHGAAFECKGDIIDFTIEANRFISGYIKPFEL